MSLEIKVFGLKYESEFDKLNEQAGWSYIPPALTANLPVERNGRWLRIILSRPTLSTKISRDSSGTASEMTVPSGVVVGGGGLAALSPGGD
jgi:hypothetical protein